MNENLKQYRLESDLQGRINNLAMSPSANNALIPVYEAIMNSIHSVQNSLEKEHITQGEIEITINFNEDRTLDFFSIKDNGEGLNEENFKSFRTYDSQLKERKGGKGVGRLTWLKVFNDIEIKSVYSLEGKKHKREFNFLLDDENTIDNHSNLPCSESEALNTLITLKNYNFEYGEKCPKKIETIIDNITAHFLSFIFKENNIKIEVLCDGVVHDLQQNVLEKILKDSEEIIPVENENFDIKINHLIVKNGLLGNNKHNVYITADRRVVKIHNINKQTGLDKAFLQIDDETGEDISACYIGILSCEQLDSSVTQERNKLEMSDDTLKIITKSAEESAKIFLEDKIDIIIKAKVKTIQKVTENFPRYRYLTKDVNEFAKNLPLNMKVEEDIYKQMSIFDYRENKKLVKLVKTALSKDENFSAEGVLDDNIAEITEKIQDQGKSALAEYVSKRKVIIDLLESNLSFDRGEAIDSEKHYKEEAIHQIICPMQVTSDDIKLSDHSLWLIDERLAYYDFWASDKALKDISSSSSKGRPDVILFEAANLFQNKGTKQPVVIIEFKRPAKKDYTPDKNPVQQIYNYIKELRESEVKDASGKLITEITEDTPFHCYIICDIVEKLKEILENFAIFRPLPDKRGYYGYHPEHRAYIQIIDFSKIIEDARIRHEAFFAKLGIN